MGLFLSAAGVIGANLHAVEQSIRSYAARAGGGFDASPRTTDDPDTAVMNESGANTTVLYPREFMEWDKLSRHISTDLRVPVFSFHIHDGDLWTFILFDKGEPVAWFNPLPDYWGELGPAEKAIWAGDADAVAARVPGLSPDAIRKYFIEWTDEFLETEEKAYPDDESPYGAVWQLTDFMKRVGLAYPVRADSGIDGRTFRLRAERDG